MIIIRIPILILILLIANKFLFCQSTEIQLSEENPNSHNIIWQDMLSLPGWVWNADKSQFNKKYTSYWLGAAAVISVSYVFDDNIDESLKRDKPFQEQADAFDKWGKVAYSFGWAGFYFSGMLAGNEKMTRTGRDILITNITANVVGTVLWFSLGRRRPDIAKNKHDFDPFNFKNLKATIPPFSLQPSFPSLHTVGISSIAVVVTKHYGFKYGIPVYALAGVVGYSRMALEGHYLSDVFAGACLGTITGLAVCEFMDEISEQKITVYPRISKQQVGIEVRLLLN